jgi:hypothetical protein
MKCTWTLKVPCKNKTKGTQTGVFKVLASHTTKVFHVTYIFWGCCSDSLIIKFDEALHGVMDKRYSTLLF